MKHLPVGTEIVILKKEKGWYVGVVMPGIDDGGKYVSTFREAVELLRKMTETHY